MGSDRMTPPPSAEGPEVSRCQDPVGGHARLQGNASPPRRPRAQDTVLGAATQREVVLDHVPKCPHQTAGPAAPVPGAPATAPCPPRSPAAGQRSRAKPRAAARPRPSQGPGPRRFLSPEISAPLSPRRVENQNCFLNWYFPVERTSYAFFTCVIELPNVFIFVSELTFSFFCFFLFLALLLTFFFLGVEETSPFLATSRVCSFFLGAISAASSEGHCPISLPGLLLPVPGLQVSSFLWSLFVLLMTLHNLLRIGAER